MIDLAGRSAEFISGLSYDELPRDVQEKAVTCLLNGIGIGIACYNMEPARAARNIVKEYEEKPRGKGGTLFMDGGRASLTGAAFANATMFHSRAQEDTHGTSHIGTIILPVILGIAENCGNSGREVLEAVVAGYEISAALGRELTAKSTPRGFRASPVYGIFSATAAAGRLLKLNVDEITSALNIATAFAGGTTESLVSGTMECTFENGTASRNGLTAALIASNGIKGARSAFTGNSGFLYAFAGVRGESYAEAIVGGLGKKFEILDVAFKPYPTCAFNQTPFIIALELVKENDIRPEDVLEVTYYMSPYEANYPGMRFKGPFSSIVHCIMSTPFTIALAVKDRRLYQSDLERFNDKELMGMVDRITILEDNGIDPLSGAIEIKVAGGGSYKKEMIITPGYYAYGWDKDVELISAVHREVGIPEEQTGRLVAAVKNMPYAENIIDLIKIIEKPFI